MFLPVHEQVACVDVIDFVCLFNSVNEGVNLLNVFFACGTLSLIPKGVTQRHYFPI